METAGLTVGAIALVSLFNTCVELFEYFEQAKSFADDYELLLVKLDVQKERLLTWGELVGISKNLDEEGRHIYLDEKQELVERCLNSILKLYFNTSQLESDYGLKQSQQPVDKRVEALSANRTNIFQKSYSTLRARYDSLKQAKIVQRTKWAIADKNKFEKLIDHLASLVNGLHDVVPVPPNDQNRLMFADAATLSVTKLKVVQIACDGEYQSLSDVASGIIVASEAGTIGRLSIADWADEAFANLEQNKAEEHQHSTHTGAASLLANRKLKLSLHHSVSLYFVYTDKCFLIGTKTNCSNSSFGQATFDRSGISFLPNHGGEAWPLDQRILYSMDVQFDSNDVEMLRSANFDLGEIQNSVMERKLPLATVYILCGPCICAIRTALKICRRQQSKLIQALVRVDDRIDTACCVAGIQLARLESLVHTMKTIDSSSYTESTDLTTEWNEHIDRVWVGKRIYALEEEAQDPNMDKTNIVRAIELFEELRASRSSKTGFVFLGELDACHWMMQIPPFPWKPKMPKVTEIYVLKPSRWERKFLGTFTPRDYHLRADSSASSTTTLRGTLPSTELHAHFSRTVLDPALEQD